MKALQNYCIGIFDEIKVPTITIDEAIILDLIKAMIA